MVLSVKSKVVDTPGYHYPILFTLHVCISDASSLSMDSLVRAVAVYSSHLNLFKYTVLDPSLTLPAHPAPKFLCFIQKKNIYIIHNCMYILSIIQEQ